MKKYLKMLSIVVTAVMFFSVVAAGCGSSQGSTNDTKTSDTPKAEGTTKEEKVKEPTSTSINGGKDITIKFWYDDPGPTGYARYKQAIEDYQKINPNVKFDINASLGWGDYWQKLPVAVQAGTGPDIMHFHTAYTNVFIPTLAAPYPEDVLPVDKLKAEFMGIDPFVIDGKIYTIPTAYMTGAMVYNKKMWADAGLTDKDFPKTWDQLREVAKKLTKRDGDNIIVNGMDINEGWLLTALSYQKGYFLFKEDGKTSQMNNPGVIEAAKMLQDMIKVDKVFAPSTGAPHERIANGKSAMAYAWTWMNGWLKGNAQGKIEWGWFAVPTFDGAKVVDRNGPEVSPIVNAKSSDEAKAVAFDFIRFYLDSDSYIAELAVNSGCAPAKIKLVNDEKIKADPVLSVVAPYLDMTIWLGFIHNQVDQNVGGILGGEILTKLTDPATALKKFDDEAAKVAPEQKLTAKERMSPLAPDLK
ncbi:MAG: extracellular solute-binding protein [Ruminiclostridium sp.]|nr:extracellular solute-binding protein [Ruminiclostridium sp.]